MADNAGSSGLSTYLYNNGQGETLNPENYNEVDGMVFAELSYMKFENAEWTADELANGVTVDQFADRMLNSGQELTPDERDFLTALQQSNRYDDCTITNLAAVDGNTMWDAGKTTTLTEDGQWAGMTINMNDPDNSAVVAMRGTNGTTLGWGEDLELGYDVNGTTAQELSRDYLKGVDADNLYLTGHSKGGNDVTSAYAMSDKEIRDKVQKVFNFDGPGHNDEFREEYAEGFKELEKKCDNYYPQDSAVGQLLDDTPGRDHYYHADSTGHSMDFPVFGEHDPFAAELGKDGASFAKDNPNPIIREIDQIMEDAMEGMSEEEKKAIIDGLRDMNIDGLLGDLSGEDGEKFNWKALLNPKTDIAILLFLGRVLDAAAFRGYQKILDRLGLGFVSELYGLMRRWAKDGVRKFKNYVERTYKKIKDRIIYEFQKLVPVVEYKFNVSIEKIRRLAAQLEDAGDNLDRQAREIQQIQDELKAMGFWTYAQVLLVLEIKQAELRKESKKAKALASTLYWIADRYEDVEEIIIGFILGTT